MTNCELDTIYIDSLSIQLFTFSNDLKKLEDICNNVLSANVNSNLKLDVVEGNKEKGSPSTDDKSASARQAEKNQILKLEISVKENSQCLDTKYEDEYEEQKSKLSIKSDKLKADVRFIQIKQDYEPNSQLDYELALKLNYLCIDKSINLNEDSTLIELIKSFNLGQENKNCFLTHLYEHSKSQEDRKNKKDSESPEDRKNKKDSASPEENPFLGQTLVISINIKRYDRIPREKLKKFADEFLDILFNDKCSNRKRPRFNRAGNLLSNPIFEYGIFSDLYNYCHVLVWFVSEETGNHQQEETPKDIFEKTYLRLLGLFLFRARIVHYFQKSCREVDSFKGTENQIQIIIDKIDKKNNLEDFENTIIEILRLERECEGKIQTIEKAHADIIKYIRRYQERMQQIRGIYPKYHLSFLQVFNQQTCRYFLDQIEADLMYVRDDSILATTVLNSIKGLVEIEKTKAENTLNFIVLGATVAVGISGVLAASEALIIEDERIKREKQSKIKEVPKNNNLPKAIEEQNLPPLYDVIKDINRPYLQYVLLILVVSIILGASVVGGWCLWRSKFIRRWRSNANDRTDADKE